MKNSSLSSDLVEKIYDLKFDETGNLFKIITYFSLNQNEKQEILGTIEKTKEFPIEFKSIFSDKISDQEWNNSKEQITKKFQDELVDID